MVFDLYRYSAAVIRSRGERGYARNITLPKMMCEHFRHMVQARLARRVGKRLQGRNGHSINTPNINNPRRIAHVLVSIAGHGRRLEQWRAQLCDRKHAVQVQRQDTRPCMVRVRIVALAPVRAGVVDEDVELLLALRELLDKTLAVFEFVEVGGDRVGRSRTCFPC